MELLNIEIIIATLGSIVAAGKWIYEYSAKNKWEKNKFLLEQLENFEHREETKVVELILDWNVRKINYGEKEYLINDAVLFDALSTHNKKSSFDPTEVFIRNVFDDYFENLTKFAFMCKVGLINEKNFRLFMEYWFGIISGKRNSKSKELREQMYKFMNYYGYNNLLDFILKK